MSWFCGQQQCHEDSLWRALESVPDGVELPIFLNGIGGLGSPWWRVAQDSRFVGGADASGQSQASIPNARVRFAALVESIAFMIAVNAEELARQAGRATARDVAGGMSRSSWLVGAWPR